MVQDREQLLSGISPTSEIVWLDGEQDGIKQISAALADRHDLDAIHFVAHGSERLVKLGSAWLMQETLAGYAEQIKGWRSALADDADLLFYTCDLASSAEGLGLLASLQALTGADIAASSNDTGHAQYGADWDLEYEIGQIDTGPLLGQSVQETWTGLLATFVVIAGGDFGAGSLRQAILDANAAPGTDTIVFDIGEAGNDSLTIMPTSALPAITSPVIIDGSPPEGTFPRIELNGASAGAGVIGLLVVSGGSGSTIRGLAINRFSSAGIWLDGNSSGNTITGNYIGTDPTGTLDLGNAGDGIVIAGSANNTIGGTTAALRNVISGNNGDGIEISNAAGIGSATGNVVWGNYIGTNAAGTAALPNSVDGIRLAVNANTNTIGVTAGGLGAGNVISGNSSSGVEVFSSTNNLIQGNFIGTNAAGTAAIPNASVGVYLLNATNTTIGGTTAAARNIISGNTFHGIQLDGTTTGTLVRGNYIGLNAAGTASIGIQDVGVSINNQNPGPTTNNTIGGTVAGARNVISGNEQDGVRIIRIGGSAVSSNVVEGNYIGTDPGGTIDLGNGQFGVSISGGATNNRIGGTSSASRNVISGNQDDGVFLSGSGTTGNQIQGNFIGTNAAGSGPLANSSSGVMIANGAGNNTIGGTIADAGNLIAFNSGDGITMTGGTGNALLSNDIYSNGGLGIDLSDNGVTLNDAGDGDTGPNNLQNFPVLTSAVQQTETIVFQGTLNSVANTSFRLDFFRSPTADPTGYGEGEIFIGFGNWTTSGSGNVTINATLASNFGGDRMTATATNLTTNDTSEFSLAIQVNTVGPVVDLNGSNQGGNDFATSWTENGGPTLLADSDATVTDADSATLQSLTVTLTTRPDGAVEGLAANTSGTPITASAYNSGTGVLLLSGAATVAQYQQVLRTVTYNSTSEAPTTTARTITFVANDGAFTSTTATTTLTILAANDPPSFTKGPDQTVNEDALAQTVANWATNISPGPGNESSQTVTFLIQGNTNPGLFAVGPAVSPTGTLTYTPAANANGSATITVALQDNGGTANGGQNTSAGQTFVITVNAVNDVPSFTKGANQTVNEDAGAQTVTGWATAISPGPSNESGQTVTFLIQGNTNPGLFSVAPAVSPTGTLTYTPAGNANGSATITVALQDSGGTANGGQNTSAGQTFVITVNAVNDAPSFTKGANQTVNEDAGAQTVAGWATNISQGPNETGQTLTFLITGNTNPGLFSVGPAISATGTLTYTPAANANGTATITVALQDNGGTANGGQNTSAGQTFVITVTSMNDPPVLTNNGGGAAAAISLPENSTAVTTLTSTDIDGGPPVYSLVGGADQARFSLNQSTGVLVFLTPPDFDAPTDADTNNVYEVTVQVSDGAGGVDQQMLSVTVTNIANSAAITTTSDVADGNTASIEALIAAPGADGVISLREALLAANNSPLGAAPVMITFGLLGTGVQTFQPASALPTIMRAMILDGTTQPGYAGLPLIELNGLSAGTGVDGLVITADGSGTTIRGLAINRFDGAGIRIEGGGTNRLEGNVIGTNAAGTAAAPNGRDGVRITGASNNLIGGVTAGAGNLISGNSQDGIEISGSLSLSNQILGNRIGTDVTGANPIANQFYGVLISGAAHTLIGHPTLAAGANRIAFNGLTGVEIGEGINNRIQGNAILANGEFGIDLGLNGISANDPLDLDGSPNHFQNYPVLTAAWVDGTVVTGTLDSAPTQTFTLEFFANAASDGSGFGEGERFLGRRAVATDGSGHAAFQFSLETPVSLGEIITATATDAFGNTSEFSAGIPVTAAGVAAFPLTITLNGTGSGTVTSSPAGIVTAQNDFAETYPRNTLVTLTATPDTGSKFVGWTGYGVTELAPTLTINVQEARTYTATFLPTASTQSRRSSVNFLTVERFWRGSLIYTWETPSPQSGRIVVGYRLYVGRESGSYDPPIFVPASSTSRTLTKLPIIQFFAAVTVLTIQIPLGPLQALDSGLMPEETSPPMGPEESGFSNEVSAIPDSGIEGWEIVDEGTPKPSQWVARDEELFQQLSPIGTPFATTMPPEQQLLRRGTHMYRVDGIANGRRDYELTMSLRSGDVGALGVLFRYVDKDNYYGFAMARDQNPADTNPQDGWIRLIKRQGGAAALLHSEEPTPYEPNQTYFLSLIAIGPSLAVTLTDSVGRSLANWSVTDPTFTGNGLAIYSANNPGSFFDLVGIPSLENPDPNLIGLEVDVTGTGRGVVTSQVNNLPASLTTRGSPAATFDRGTSVTLTATPDAGYDFGGWKDFEGNLISLERNLTLSVNEPTIVEAIFTGVPRPPFNLDLNGDGLVTAETDGRVALKYLGGVLPSGPLATSLVSPQATTAMLRPTGADVKSWLDTSGLTMLDVDLDGRLNPFTDGRLIHRFLQQRDQNMVDDVALLNGSVRGATARRTDPAEIRAFLNQYLPVAAAVPSTEALGSGLEVSGAQVVPSAESSVLSEGPLASSSQLSAAGNASLTTSHESLVTVSSAIGDQLAVSDLEPRTSDPAPRAPNPVPASIVPMGFASLSVQSATLGDSTDDQPLLSEAPAWLGDFVVSSAVLTDDPNRDLAVVMA